MILTFRQRVLAMLCGLFLLGTASSADAGFLVSAGGEGLSFPAATGESSTPVEEDSAPQREIKPQVLPHALFAGQAAGGMSPQSVTGSHAPVVGYAVAVAEPTTTSGRLDIWLARQRDRYHPRFIKSRLFRPPRV